MHVNIEINTSPCVRLPKASHSQEHFKFTNLKLVCEGTEMKSLRDFTLFVFRSKTHLFVKSERAVRDFEVEDICSGGTSRHLATSVPHPPPNLLLNCVFCPMDLHSEARGHQRKENDATKRPLPRKSGT